MSSPSQPSGFAAFFSAQQTASSSAPFVHGYTSPPRTDSPPDSKGDSVKETPLPVSPPLGSSSAYAFAATPVPTPPSAPATTPAKKALDISNYTKRAWKLVHDPELHSKGSIGRSKPKEIRQSGQGVSPPAVKHVPINNRLQTSLIREDSNSIMAQPRQKDAKNVYHHGTSFIIR
jgi:hypothetical protein